MTTTPQPPPVEGRDYRALLAETMARIPVHNPEWTNHNDADPGITLLQLWAYLAESVSYRASLVPERNRQAFLRLVGYQRAPAQAATGMVTFEHRSGQLGAHVLRPDLELTAGSVPFRTDQGLDVLPVEGKAFVKRRRELSADERAEVESEYRSLYPGFTDPERQFAYYETSEVDWRAAEHESLDLATTVDGSLWIALLARPGDAPDATRNAVAHRTLALGVIPGLETAGRSLPPVGSPVDPQGGLEVALPRTAVPLPEHPTGRVATYVPLRGTATADLATETGILQLLPAPGALGVWALDPTEDGVGDFPPALEGADADRLVTWLRIRPVAAAGSDQPATAVRLRWAGINASMVRQRAHVQIENLGTGTGGADQSVRVANVPVLPESLHLSVGSRPWHRVDDLATAAPEVPLQHGSATVLADPVERVAVYVVDRQSGDIRFGDGIHGARPGAGEPITASYDYGGGRVGLVPAGAINQGAALPTGVAVRNPVATWGGAEAETVEAAERQVTGTVRHRDRLVTAADIVDVTHRTPGVELGRVEVIPLFDPAAPDAPSPGAVTVMVVPRFDVRTPETPEPDRHVLGAVCGHLDPRRLVTTELHVHGPEYVSLWLSVGVDPVPGRDMAVVRDAVSTALRRFLSPLTGGRSGDGWPLRADVERLEAWAVAARAEGVAKVTGVLLGRDDGVDVDRAPLTGLQLPRMTVAVRPGPPQPLDELGGAAVASQAPLLPIPFVPAEC